MKYLIFLGMKRERDIYMLYDVGLQVGSWTIATDLCGMYGIHFEMESFLSFFLGKKPGISSVLSSWSIPKTLIFLLRFLGPGKTFGSTPLATFWIRQFLRAAWKLDQFGTETPLRPVRLGLPTAIQEGIAPDEPPQTHHDWGMVMDGCHSMVYSEKSWKITLYTCCFYMLLSPYLRVTSWTMPIFADRPWKTETTSFKRGSHESDLDSHLDSARANVVSKCWSLSQVGLLLCCCEPNVAPQDADRRRTGVRCCHVATVPLCGTAAPFFDCTVSVHYEFFFPNHNHTLIFFKS